LTQVQDFIDATRCAAGRCGGSTAPAAEGFVILQYANQSARLYGFDLSGHAALGSLGAYGSLAATGVLGYVRGENRTTGDGLYNITPLNGKLTFSHLLGGWTGAIELVGSADKRQVSRVRNEVPTGGHALVNLRGSFEWRFARLDVSLENLFDRYYALPLGGAYVGQGPSMTTGGIPWGVPVPGRGRSCNVSLGLRLDSGAGAGDR
jgi:iron complex outermembrane receptor protein